MKIICLLNIAIILFIYLTNTDAAPLVKPGIQLLPSREGYIPVYIVDGNTPLEEINPQLAEAFRAHEKKYSIPKGKRISSSKQYVQPKTLELLLNGFKYGDKDKIIGNENQNEENRKSKAIVQENDVSTEKPREAMIYRINFNPTSKLS
ncbi:uncharacterized protein LOC123295637 [Chrysoperla carnea]|uniref:uncharacterized protein LOC123295637 n=1 Tax=Chrysoperla carnea TaxID=189513 RepID=UPI001D0701DF|nr:uncharacterized protein LOC123295637 [Chrysoperla carnea]